MTIIIFTFYTLHITHYTFHIKHFTRQGHGICIAIKSESEYMKIAISGSTGLVGNAVIDYFRQQGHDVWRIVRQGITRCDDPKLIEWDTQNNSFVEGALEGYDAVISFNGANIASQRWTTSYKKKIYDSRVETMKNLSSALVKLKQPPKCFLSASAIGIYGLSETHQQMDESAGAANDFLANVCLNWEKALEKAMEDSRVRVVQMRIAAVLSKKSGAVGKMLLPFLMGVGGRLGRGDQMFSWVALDEVPLIIEHIIDHQNISGPVNFVSPKAVSNLEFTKSFGKVIKRPTIFPVPALGVKLLLGEMGETLLLGSQHIYPKVLLDSGYKFQYPHIDKALEQCFTSK